MPNANYTIIGAGNLLIAAAVGQALPADTVAKDTFGSWTSWTNLGYTQGVQAKIGYDVKEVEVDQSTIGVRRYVTKQEVMIEATLAEATLANLKYALGFGSLSTSGSTAVLTIGDNPTLTEYSIAVEGQSPNAAAAFRRAQIYRVTPQSDIELVMAKDDQTLWKATFQALLYTSGAAGNNVMQIRDYTA